MNNKVRIIVILSFDAEQNIGWEQNYSGLLAGTPILLDILKKENIKTTFFVVGEAAKLYPDLIKDIFNMGHEIGCHGLYHDIYGDPFYDIPGCKPLLPEELKNRIEIATKLIAKTVGVRPVSFRSPRGWSSTACINVLEKLGYIADSSYIMANYKSKQLIPYHPSKNNWLEKGEMKILEIPNFGDITGKPNTIMSSCLDQWPILRLYGAKSLIKHTKNFISYLKERELPIILSIYLHPWEFAEMPTKFIFREGYLKLKRHAYKNTGEYAIQEFKKLIEYLEDENVIFNTIKDIAKNFKT